MAELPIIMRFRDEASRLIQGVGRELQGLEQSASRAGLQTAALEQRSSLLAQEMSRLGKEVAQGKISVDQAEKEFDKFESTLAKVEAQAEETQGVFGRMRSGVSQAGQAWTQLATPIQSTIAILQQAKQAAQEAYQYVGEGAQMSLAEDRFAALTRSVGTTSDALLGDLKIATRGTVSDFELMNGASQLLNLGLTKTAEETVRLGSVAGKLNWDMNVLGLTIANQSTMRLDALGLSMTDVQGRAEALRAQGMATDQAFKFAIIEAGEAKLQLLGDSADTAAGKLKILETNAANLSENFKSTFSEELITNVNDLAGGIFETQEGASQLGDTLGQVAVAALLFSNSAAIAKKNIGEAQGATGQATEGMRQSKSAVEDERRAVIASMTAYDDRTEAIGAHNRILVEANTLLANEAAILYNETSPAYAELQDKLEQSTYHLSENEAMVAQANARLVEWGQTIPAVTGAIYASDEAVAAYNARLGEYYLQAQNTVDGTFDVAAAFTESASQLGANANQLAAIQMAFGDLEPAQAEAILKQAALSAEVARLTQEIITGNMTVYEARDAYLAFQEGLNSSQILVNEATGSVLLMNDAMVGSSSAIGSLQTDLDSFSTGGAVSETQAFLDRLNSIPRDIDVNVNVHGGDTSGANYGGGGYQQYSRGGRVRGGIPGRDSVPALLMPDEEVLTVDEARQYRQLRQSGALSGLARPYQASGARDSAVATSSRETVINAPINITIPVTGGVADRNAAQQIANLVAKEVTEQLNRLGVVTSNRVRLNV